VNDEAVTEEPSEGAPMRSAGELDAARTALEQARRQIRWPSHNASPDGVALGSTDIGDGTEPGDHRSEKLHRAELMARDVTIGHLRQHIAELEMEVHRLRTALQVVTGLPVPDPGDNPVAGPPGPGGG
jgi:hypothetical protein